MIAVKFCQEIRSKLDNLMVFLLAKCPIISAIDGESDSCDSETREHVASHGAVGEDGVLSPCFTTCPRIVISGDTLLCFLMGLVQ